MRSYRIHNLYQRLITNEFMHLPTDTESKHVYKLMCLKFSTIKKKIRKRDTHTHKYKFYIFRLYFYNYILL